jgi:hypothetical protein
MRRSAQLATVGLTVLVVGGGTAAAQSVATSRGAASTSTVPAVSVRWSGSCRFTATPRELSSPRIPLRSAPSHRSGGATGGGTIEATISKAVFVRASGRQLTVTTNTGRSPRDGDQFYFVANGRAGMASGELTRRVEAECR